MPEFIGPNGKNPWGLRITNFHQGLARVTPEEVEHWAGPGLEEAKAIFSKISRDTVMEFGGKTYRGGANPRFFSTSTKAAAAQSSGIPELENVYQQIHYASPSTSSGIEGCNTCGYETSGCTDACFAHGGQLGLPSGVVARLARTKALFTHPAHMLGIAEAEMRDTERRNARRGRVSAFRFGGTSEDLIHLMKASEVLLGNRHPDSKVIVYSKAQSRDVVPTERLIFPNYGNLTLATSVTEHTTVPRMLQASEEQGQVLATPFRRLPHARYPSAITMVDRQGRMADFATHIDPTTVDEFGHGESLGDTSDDRSLDTYLSGIRGGVLPLGGKKVYFTDESGRGTAGVRGGSFIREVNPSRQIRNFQLEGLWKGPEGVSLRRRGR